MVEVCQAYKTKKIMNIKDVQEHPSAIFLISAVTGVTLREMIGETRKQPIASYRQVLIWFLWYEGIHIDGITETTGRDRTTILYAVKRVDDLIQVRDKSTINLISRINLLKKEIKLMDKNNILTL